MPPSRLKTGNSAIDEMLGGGLLPGTLTVVLGSTGIGKTQLGIQFAQFGRQQEGERGIVFDLTSRGDSQNHSDYAARQFGWQMTEQPVVDRIDPAVVWDARMARRDYMHIFQQSGRRVTRSTTQQEDWKEWKVEFSRKLVQAIAFFYGNFIHGVRRCVVDGVEPTDNPADSFQFYLFDYVYHQILRKESEWVARDLFRVQYRANADRVTQHAYNHADVGCLLLCTSHEVMLDELLSRPLETGDVLSNAGTIILMGRVREGNRMTRALHIAKHRGSAVDESIAPFEITDDGIQLSAGQG